MIFDCSDCGLFCSNCWCYCNTIGQLNALVAGASCMSIAVLLWVLFVVDFGLSSASLTDPKVRPS